MNIWDNINEKYRWPRRRDEKTYELRKIEILDEKSVLLKNVYSLQIIVLM